MGCRYVYQTLMNSPDVLVETIEEADVVYVYDYCYVMWALGDHHAREHWWLRENYHPKNGSKAGHYLLSTYRHVPACGPHVHHPSSATMW